MDLQSRRQWMSDWSIRLSAPVSGASLAALRIAFGVVMLYEALWFLGMTPNAPRGPTVLEYWYTGEHVQWTFSLLGIEQLRPLPSAWMHGLFMTLAVSSACVALGLAYRIAVTVLATGFTYVILLEAAFYQNHFYLASLIAWLLVLSPAHACCSLDAILRRRPSTQIPFWPIFLLRFQMVLVYFYAGLAKINADWLSGEPLRTWLRQPSVASFLGQFISDGTLATLKSALASELVVWTMSYGGLFFDLLIGVLLVWRPTRLMAVVLAGVFHGINFCLFDVGAFPVLAMGCTLIFLNANWPLRLGRWLRKPFGGIPSRREPLVDLSDRSAIGEPTWRLSRSIATFVIFWVSWQTLLPLRHFAIPGYASWTEEGHAFSWRMMLRTKVPGPCHLEIRDLWPQASALQDDDWQCIDDGFARLYRQIASDPKSWQRLPPVVLTCEPILGERIIFNPHAGESWSQAAARVRQIWQARYGSTPVFRRTWPLRDTLLQLRHLVSRASQPGRDARLVSEIDVAIVLNDLLRQEADEPSRQQSIFELQSALHRIVSHQRWRKKTLGLFMQTTPFALQGHVQDNVPFMVIVSPELMEQGRHCAVAINRELWQGEGEVLIDLHRLSPIHMRSLPQVIVFDDFEGRRAAFWNYAVDLHTGQYNLMRRSPRALHQYANRVARLCRDHYGQRPEIFASSHVRLNHHPLRPIVDSNVNLASVSWSRWSHNDWILPFSDERVSQPDMMEVSRTREDSDRVD